MRILRIDLLAYGAFTKAQLDFTAAPDALQVIYGPNEAGKSTTLRALKAFFHGFDHVTSDAFLHKTSELRVGALLEASDGTRHALVRRKGNKNTLLGPDGEVVDEALLRALLAGVAAEGFRSGFALDHETLRKGGEALEQGDAGASIFDAGRGVAGAAKLAKQLDAEARACFTDRGTKPPLNDAIGRFKAASVAVRAAALPAEDFLRAEAAERALADEVTALGSALDEARRKRARLERLRRALVPLARRDEARRQLEAFGALPRLTVEEIAKSRAERATRADLARAIEASAAAVAQSDAALAKLPADLRLAQLDEPTREWLEGSAGELRRIAHERPLFERDLSTTEARVAESVAALGLPGRAEAEAMRPRPEQSAALRSLAGARRDAERAREAASATARVLAAQLARLDEAQDEATAPCDIAALAAVLEAAQGDRDVELRARQARESLVGQELALQEALHDLQPLDEQALERVQRPLDDSVQALEAAWAELDMEARAVAEEEARLATERRGHDAARAALLDAGDVPSEDGLAEARARRDLRWREVRAGADAGGAVGDALELAIHDADAVADALRIEAKRVAELRKLDADLRALAARDEAHAARRARLDAASAQLATQLDALVAPLATSAATPKALGAFLRRLDTARELRRTVVEARHRLAGLESAGEARRHELITVLGGDVSGSLAALIERAKLALASGQAVVTAREQRTRERARIASDHAEAEAKLAVASETCRSHADALRDAAAAVGLRAEATIEEVEARLAAFEESAAAIARLRALEASLAALDADCVALERASDELSAQFADDLRTRPLGERLQELRRRAREAMAQLPMREDNERRRSAAQREGEEAIRSLAELDSVAEARRRALGVDDEEALMALEERALEAIQLSDKLALHEAELLEVGEGASVEQLTREAATLDRDALPVELQALEEQLRALEAERSAQSEALGAMRRDLADKRARSAAEAASDAAACLADVQREALRYARLRLAERLLARQIEDYRSTHQGPLLTRASELLPRLTLGRYVAIRAELGDDDARALRVVRADGTALATAELSDGTKDQVFLALRVAAIEAQAATAPLPLILDDTLLHFDDDRARAALAVLGELARTTQVLFFTHHARLVELAGEALGPSGFALSGFGEGAPRAKAQVSFEASE